MSRISLFITTFLLCLQPVLTFAAKSVQTAPATEFTTDYRLFDANRIRNWFSNIGEITTLPTIRTAGLEWPTGTGLTAVFTSGLWIAGKVNGEIRTAAAEYSSEFQPGKVIYDSVTAAQPGIPDDPTLAKYKIYTINRGDVTSDDYLNWPVADGAPVDAEGKPLLLGDQTHWYVCNDFESEVHRNLWDSNPLGLEVQTTVWGYNTPEFRDVMFIKWLIINKSGQTIQDAYIGIWSDPDVGQATDDYVGCDTILNIGYCYNGDSLDRDYGLYPPAVGYDLLQGPIVPSVGDSAFASGEWIQNYKNINMTAFIKYTNASDVFRDPDGRIVVYYYLRGLTYDGKNWRDPDGNIIHHLYAGDPVTKSGYTEFDDDDPGDRRFLMSSGPFDLASWIDSDTDGIPEVGEQGVQEVVAAVIIAAGNSNLNSVAQLKDLARFTATYYRYQDNRPHITLTNPVADSVYSGTIYIQWTDDPAYPIADKVNIELSTDNGYSWQTLVKLPNNPGSFTWNPYFPSMASTPDFGLGKIRVVGFSGNDCLGFAENAGTFSFNNIYFNTSPQIFNIQQESGYNMDISEDFPLQWQIVDPDNTDLSISLQMKNNFQDWLTIFTDLPAKGEWVWPSYLFPNSSDCHLRLCASDNINTTTSEIPHHLNVQNERRKSISLNHVSGRANPLKIRVALVDSAQTNSLEHEFEIRFEAGDATTYSIWDLSTNTAILSGLSVEDSLNESPLFEGLAATVYGYSAMRYLPGSSGWTQGDCNWYYDLVSQSGRHFPAEYEIRFTASGSTDINGTSAPYEIWNITDNRQPTFLAYKIEANRYVIAIYEEYNGTLQIVWVITLTAPTTGSVAPATGDICHFYISIPLAADDVYRFSNRYTGIENETFLPNSFALLPGYPNPFNPTTTILYQLPEQTSVEITAYNLLGQQVKRLVKEQKPAGTYFVIWDAADLPSGIYLIRMTAGDFYKVQKYILLK